jgi:hypothetical protein
MLMKQPNSGYNISTEKSFDPALILWGMVKLDLCAID